MKESKSHLKFTIRGVLLTTMLVATVFGWYSSSQRANKQISKLSKKLSYLRWKIVSGDDLENPENVEKNINSNHSATDKNVFSNATFDRVNMRGISVNGQFQEVIFDHCILQSSSLSGEKESFQEAIFNNCNLINAKLSGGNESFNNSSFVDSDLTSAILNGGADSFRRASFQRAKLIGAKILCSGASFRLANIDGTQFQGADLSAIESSSLKNCVFETPPHYDDNTLFPNDFEPSEQHWIRDQ